MVLSSLLQKLLFVNQFSIKDGKIEILGKRYIMLDADDLVVLQDIDKTKMYKAVKDSTKSSMQSLVEHVQVYKGIKYQSLKNIAELSKKIGKTDEGVIKTLQSLFEIYGLGKLLILDLDNKNKRAFLRIEKSTIALSQLEKARTRIPVCTLTAGILAGIFSYIFNKDVDCIEKECLATGKEFCQFEVG